MQCLTEAPLAGCFKGSSIGYDTLGSSICVEAGGTGDVVVSGRHVD